jgi:spermidine synthase
MKLVRSMAVLAALTCSMGAQADYDRSKLHPVYQEKSLYRNILILEGPEFRCMTFGRYHGEQSCVELAQRDRLVFPYTKALLCGLLRHA